MTEQQLRRRLIRLAKDRPGLRKDLLPILASKEGISRSQMLEGERREMERLLKRHGYDSRGVEILQRDGIGPVELEERLRRRPGSVGSLEYTHNLERLASKRAGGRLTASRSKTAGVNVGTVDYMAEAISEFWYKVFEKAGIYVDDLMSTLTTTGFSALVEEEGWQEYAPSETYSTSWKLIVDFRKGTMTATDEWGRKKYKMVSVDPWNSGISQLVRAIEMLQAEAGRHAVDPSTPDTPSLQDRGYPYPRAASKSAAKLVAPKVPPMNAAKARKIMWDGFAVVKCPVCGYKAKVEPDASYPCPRCKEGLLVSPLIQWGMI